MPEAIVTGAARGIGLAIAQRFLADGWRVGMLDRTPLESVPEGAVGLLADTTDEAAVEAALDRFGAVPDLVVNNAGIVRFGPLLDMALVDVTSVLDVNLVGTFVVARAVARRMVAAGRPGAIVNITSINGLAPGPGAGAYGATKAAVALLTGQMAVEWGPFGIRVNAVAPGLIDAGMGAPIYADPAVRAVRAGRVPLGRLGRADDIADVVAFLASDGARYITGQNLAVDGGVASTVISGLPRPPSVDQPGATPDVSSRGETAKASPSAAPDVSSRGETAMRPPAT